MSRDIKMGFLCLPSPSSQSVHRKGEDVIKSEYKSNPTSASFESCNLGVLAFPFILHLTFVLILSDGPYREVGA